jgi:hypothetical protein
MTRWSMMRGDDTPFPWTVTDDGTPLDITGMELTWVAKRRYDDADDADSTIVKTIGDGITVESEEDGTIIVQLDAADTATLESDRWPWGHTYVWNLRTVDDYEQVRTRGRGTLDVYREVAITSA